MRLMDGDLSVREYKLNLTATVKGNLKTCRRMATAALIEGRSVCLTSDIWRAARLLSHHAWEKEYQELREIINELITELNYIAEIAAAASQRANSARKESREQGHRQLCADYGTTEEELVNTINILTAEVEALKKKK